MTITVNYIAVLAAAIAAFVLGFLWHGPLFGKQWMALSGITDAQVAEAKAKGGMGKTMVVAFIAQLIIAFVLAHFATVWGATDIRGALELAFWVWLGFIVAVHLNTVLWENRSVPLYLFNVVYHLVSLCAMALVVSLWR